MKRTLALILAILLALSTMALAESAEPEAPAVELEEFTIGDEVEAAPAEEPAVEALEAPEDCAVAAPSADEPVAMGIEPMNAPQSVVLAKEKNNGEITLALREQRRIDPAFATANGWTVIDYRSSRDKVVTVDGNGLLTACAEGRATITVKTDNKKRATIKVKVVDPYKPTGVSILQGKEITLAVRESVQLDAVLSPSTAQSALEWKSGRSKVATVDGNGVVYAAAEGRTTIAVKTYNRKKALIKVKVVDPYKPTGVTIAQGKSATLNMGDTLQLNANLEPATAQTTLEWKSSRPSVATVDGSGFVTVVGRGSATITVRTHNGKRATFKVKVLKTNEIELSGYYKNKTTVASFANKFGLTLQSKMENRYGRYTLTKYCNNGTVFVYGFATEQTDEPSISVIELKKPSNYTLCGAAVGMNYNTAVSTISKYAKKHRLGIDEDDVYAGLYELYDDDKDIHIWITFRCEGGIVTEIGCGDLAP